MSSNENTLKAFGIGALIGGALMYLTLYHSNKMKGSGEAPADQGSATGGDQGSATGGDKQPPPVSDESGGGVRTEIMSSAELAKRLRGSAKLFF